MCRINPLSAACAVLLAISLVSCGYDISDRPLALASQGSLWLAREDGSQRILIDSNTLSFAWVGDKIYWVKAHADENEDSDEQQEAKPIREIDLLWTDPTSAWETGSQPMQTAETWKGIPVPEKRKTAILTKRTTTRTMKKPPRPKQPKKRSGLHLTSSTSPMIPRPNGSS